MPEPEIPLEETAYARSHTAHCTNGWGKALAYTIRKLSKRKDAFHSSELYCKNCKEVIAKYARRK